MIEVLENIQKIVKFWEKLPKSKRPNSKSYVNVKSSLEDSLVLAQLHFFSYVAGIVEPFLKKFQTDKPMIPFLFFELKHIVIRLLEIIVKPKIIESCKSARQLKEIDLSDKNNLLPLEKINTGFAVDNVIKDLIRSDTVTSVEVKKFRAGAQLFVVAMLTKLFERCPLGSAILRCASIFDPSRMSEMSKEKIQEKWKGLLRCLMELGIMAPQRCDRATTEFKAFIIEDLPQYQAEFRSFSPENDKLDEFYFRKLRLSKYNEVSFVVKLLLTISHGQAAVERGFSNNNDILKTNMSPETVIAKRLIKDHMLAHELKPHTIEVTKAMVKAYRNAHAKYKLSLEEEKKKVALCNKEKQALHLSNDIDQLAQRVKHMKKAIDVMDKEFVDCARLAEEKNDMSLLIKGNGLKRKSEKTKEEIASIEEDIVILQEKKRKLTS